MYFPLCQSGRGEEACEEEIQLFQSTSALCVVGAREGRTGAEREVQEESMRENQGRTEKRDKWRGKAFYMCTNVV